MDADPGAFFNFLGFISSAATAYIYESVHRAENLLDRCIVHFAASLAMMELAFVVNNFTINAAPFTCAFASSAFLWSIILMIQMEREFMLRRNEASTEAQSIRNNVKPMEIYLLIGYGFPFLIFTYYGGARAVNSAIDMLIGIAFLIHISSIILNGIAFFLESTILLRQLDNGQTSFKSNDPLQLNTRQVKFKRRFMNKLFQILMLPSLIYGIYVLFLCGFIPIESSEVCYKIMINIPLIVIGSQGILLFFNLVFCREQIWKDLNREYGWKKPDKLRTWDEMYGKDDDEATTKNTDRRDLLANIYYLIMGCIRLSEKAYQMLTTEVHPQNETQSMQPAIHQYVGGLPGAAYNIEATRKLNEIV